MRSPSLDPSRTITSNSSFKSQLSVPTSKSRANRMLFLAAIDKRPITLLDVPNSSDVEDMILALRTIGLKIEREKSDVLTIVNSFPECETDTKEPMTVECGYGGTTTRFLAALLALGSRRYHLEAQGYMRQRPMSEIIAPLESLGVDIKFGSDEAWLVIQGPVKTKLKELEVDSSRSTQFASALAMTLSLWQGRVVPTQMKASEDYFEMTLDCIKNTKETQWVVPADFSSLSYPLALAALSGEVIVKNVHGIDPYQPDSIFIEILKAMQAKVELVESGLRVSKSDLLAWSGDCSAFPDLVPTLAVVCAYAKGTSRLKNLSVLKHKECDRLIEVHKILQLFGVSVTIEDSDLVIEGPMRPLQAPVKYTAPDDHRMIMIAALMMRLNHGGEIENWNHVRKSYVNFFEDIAEA